MKTKLRMAFWEAAHWLFPHWSTRRMNEHIIKEATVFVQLFSKARIKAAQEHDEQMLIKLALMAAARAGELSTYIDQTDPQDLDPKILALYDHCRENAEQLGELLEPTSEGEDWKGNAG